MATTVSAPTDDRSEELRLALVLNGGVSLAVWMGGVAHELNRLARETHPAYLGLLQLTGTVARIDVISGTSAGGINGAALALAQIHDQGLAGLRDTWLDTAGLEQLLRDPDDADLNSLLRGNDWFLPKIQETFSLLAKGSAAPKSAVPMFLSLTSTLLDGIGNKRLDDFGAVIEDTVHKALWRFDRIDQGKDDFAHPEIVPQLAAAARATASFPVAFEPARFDPAAELFSGVQVLKVRQSPDKPIATEAFLLDGGILDNQPFDAALQAIARLPANGNTRRVLAYVVPDPAAQPTPRDTGPDGKLIAPTLAEVAWRSLIGIPMSQSIASNMARLREQNTDVARRWQRLVGVITEVQSGGLLQNAATLFPAYRRRRLDGILDYFLEQIELGLASPATGEREVGMRRATRLWLRTTWHATSNATPTLWVASIPTVFAPGTPLLSGGVTRWPWGLYALEFVAEFTTEVLRRTQRLRALLPRWRESADAGGGGGPGGAPAMPVVPGAPWPEPAPADADWEQADVGSSAAGGSRRPNAAPRIGDAATAPLWEQVYRIAAAAKARRDRGGVGLQRTGREGFAALIDHWTEQGGQVPPQDDAERLLHAMRAAASAEGEAKEGTGPATDHADADSLVQVLAALQPLMDEIIAARESAIAAQADQADQPKNGRADIAAALAELTAIRAYLYTASDAERSNRDRAGGAEGTEGTKSAGGTQGTKSAGGGDSRDAILWRVLALEVFEVCGGSRSRAPDAQAEVIQISARQSSAWGGTADPHGKVNGIQLAHFGAFYKRSWRANDWTFGRLDGIDSAVRIALNPDALQRRYGARRLMLDGHEVAASAYVMRYLRALAVDGASDALRPTLASAWREADILKELDWLDQPSTLPPPVLVECAAALSRRLQIEALRHELPEIATWLVAERAAGAQPSASPARPIIDRVAPDGRAVTPSAKDAVALVRQNLLGGETVAQQAGTDLYTRTVSQAMSTLHGALSARQSGFNAIHLVLRLTEWPLRFVYWTTNRFAGGGTGAAVEGAAIGAGAVLVAASVLTPGLSETFVALGWSLLAGSALVTLLRRMRWGIAFGALSIGLLLVVLPSPSWWQAAGAGVALFAVLQPWSSVPAAVLALLGAAYWSSHASPDAVLAALCDWRLRHGVCPVPTPALAAVAARVERVMAAALVICGLIVVSALARHVRRGVRGRWWR